MEVKAPPDDENIDVLIDSPNNDEQEESSPEIGYFAAETCPIFSAFLQKAKRKAAFAEEYFNEIKKHIIGFKDAQVLTLSALIASYEIIVQKSLDSKKNWNEGELLYLTSIITYYCLIYDLDCGELVTLRPFTRI